MGSVHTVSNEVATHVKKYIRGRKAIVGGDQRWDFCARASLCHVDKKSHYTFPASCTSSGRTRGDIICSNLLVMVTEGVRRPCINANSESALTLSDHAFTNVSLSLYETDCASSGGKYAEKLERTKK